MKKNIQKGECGMKKYLMGTWVEGWREAKAQNLTFIVTEDCNLRCKYCYVGCSYGYRGATTSIEQGK